MDDDPGEAATITFEWTDPPDPTAVTRLLAHIEDGGDIERLGLEVEASGFDVGSLVGEAGEAVAEDRGPHLNASTKAYWAGVAIHERGNEWTTAKELADLLSDGEAVTRNNAHAYLTTLSNNRVLETRTRATEGRGANPTEYRLSPEGTELVGSVWDEAGDPPEGFRADLSLGGGGDGDDED